MKLENVHLILLYFILFRIRNFLQWNMEPCTNRQTKVIQTEFPLHFEMYLTAKVLLHCFEEMRNENTIHFKYSIGVRI